MPVQWRACNIFVTLSVTSFRMLREWPVFEELGRCGCDLHDFKSIKVALVRHGMLENLEQIWPIWHHAHPDALDTHPEHFLTDTQRQELHDKAAALLGQRQISYTWLLYCCLVEMGLNDQADVACSPARREHYIKRLGQDPPQCRRDGILVG